MSKKTFLKTWLVISVFLLASSVKAQTIWNGPLMTFTKTNYTDWTNAANQDHITNSVWLTRKGTQGLFNIAQEAGFGSSSPADTEWAYGSAVNWQSLTFQSWGNWHGWNPPSMLGQDAVLHLITDDIYIDIKFLSWAQGIDGGSGGGGFSYERPTHGYCVDGDATGSNDGSSWEDAFLLLQDALDLAIAGNQIWVAEGTYYPDSSGLGDPREATFQLISGVELYGGYAGYGDPIPNERDPNQYETILSGDIGTPIDPNDNSYHVVTASNVDSNSILSGFTITAGNANGSGDNNSGSGMFNNSSSPTITDCIFVNNFANIYGGGMCNLNNSSPLLTNCSFNGNLTPPWGEWSGGSGMYNDQSSPTLIDCIFSENSASYGGGIWNYSSSPTLINCSFMENTGNLAGGGIANYTNSNPMLTNCTFTGGSSRMGGGMFNNDNSNPTLTNCLFVGNSADWGGGGMNNYQSNPNLVNCTFVENTGNAYDGGGMHNSQSSPTLKNCIFWGNTANDGNEISLSSSTIDIDYSDVQGGPAGIYDDLSGNTINWGVGNIVADPLFIDADGADNIPGTEDDNLRLQYNSPCIDSGDPNYVAGPDETDLDGHARIVDGDFDGTATVDMGAYERERKPVTFYVDENAGGANDGTSWADAFNYLQDVFNVPSVVGDEIYVAQGTYRPDEDTSDSNGSDDRYATFQLISGVELHGGYAGYGAADPNARNIALYETILSGDLAGDDDVVIELGPGGGSPGENCAEAGPINKGETSFSTVGSTTDGPGDCDAGRDIWYVYTADSNEMLKVSLCGSDYDTYLGVYEGVACPPTNLLACNDDYCGYQSEVSIPVVEGTDYLIRVGGYDTETGTGIITVIRDLQTDNSYNIVTGSGTDQTALLDGFTITAGNADYGSYPDHTLLGGGMYNDNGSPTVNNCSFTGNAANFGGGGMYNTNSSPTLTNCIFISNSASSYGGGMCNENNSSPTATNCTFTGNSASFYGGGIYNYTSSSIVTNCILWGNTDSSGGNEIALEMYSTINVDYCDVQGGQVGIHSDFSGNTVNWGSGNINTDPMLADIPDQLRLLSTSPCIDAGDNSVVDPNSTDDLDGLTRIVDGDCDTTATVDMGAYEFDWLYIGDFAGGCDIDLEDFSVLALNWQMDNPAIDIAPFLNPDGLIDLKELLVLGNHWLEGAMP